MTEAEPLPHWAESQIEWGVNGYLCERAQLCTRDGRKIGNAVIVKIEPLTEWVFTVITDAGNTLILNIEELQELFHPPKFIMHRAPSCDPVVWRWINSNGDVVTNWLEYKANQKLDIEQQVAAAGGVVEYAYAAPTGS